MATANSMTAVRVRKRNWVDRTRVLWRLGNRWEVLLLRHLGVSGMSLLRRTPLIVLETTGRRSGRVRAVPVAFWEHGGAVFIGGGAAGMTRVDWVANLRAHPNATIVRRRQRIEVLAEELSGSAYERARRYALSQWPSVPKYERMSQRRVPYFKLVVRS
jgi:deazaflavin-dependent oxidoreductase (nitroreductase family)